MKRFHVSKNLFDKDNATVYDCYVTSNGQWATGAGNKTVRISCSSNTQYTLSTASTYAAFRIMETGSDNIPSDGSPVSGTLIYYGSGNTYTFTTSNTAKYIIFQANSASLSQWLSELMFNTGSIALPYEPYGNTWQTKSPPRYGTATDAVTNLPVEIFTDGQPVSSYTLKGNTTTSGTPSPSNPITINGVGDKTANLLDESDVTYDGTRNVSYLTNNPYHLDANEEITVSLNHECTAIYIVNASNDINLKLEQNTDTVTYTRTSALNIYIKLRFDSGVPQDLKVMLNEGSRALPYEPYGKYKISISSNQAALSPIYLSQPLRKSLDGTAFDTLDSTGLVTYNVDEYGQPQTATTETVTVPTITTTGGEVSIDVDTTVKPSEISLTYHGWHSHEPLKRENGSWS